MPDQELVERIAKGKDDEAWTTLVDRHSPGLLAFLSKWASYHTAQEILQETWLSAFAGVKRGQVPKRFRAWIYTIAHRAAINRHYRCKDDGHATLCFDPVTRNDGDSGQDDRADGLLAALDDLAKGDEYDRRKASVLRGHYWEGKSIAKMATELNLPAGTIKRTIHAAKKDLKRALGGE